MHFCKIKPFIFSGLSEVFVQFLFIFPGSENTMCTVHWFFSFNVFFLNFVASHGPPSNITQLFET